MVTTFGMNDLDILPKKFYIRLVETCLECPATFPKEVPICRGCSQGKMTSSSFPESLTRAAAPFNLIHMDLKALPILSYHKYKYILTFLNDHTSHGWISLLKNKSDTAKAIEHFVAMVSTQYKSRVWAVMSDFGGEFPSLRLE